MNLPEIDISDNQFLNPKFFTEFTLLLLKQVGTPLYPKEILDLYHKYTNLEKVVNNLRLIAAQLKRLEADGLIYCVNLDAKRRFRYTLRSQT